MSLLSVLIVEDDKDVRENLAFILKEEGFSVSTAEHGEAALGVLRGTDTLPGCILLDLMMPVMDGLTFLTVIKKDHAFTLGKIPILVVSAFGPSTWPTSWAKLPAEVERVKKPVDLDDLLKRLRHLCGSSSIQ